MSPSKFQRASPQLAALAEKGVLHDPIAKLPRSDLLTIQFTKCINYFRDDTAPEWGGWTNDDDQAAIEAGYQRFVRDVDAFGDPAQPFWLRKKLEGLPWGPDNFRLRAEPCVQLGYPYEPYLTVNGAILTVNQASRILSIKMMDMVRLKISLLVDSRVIDEAIKRMLQPRPLWPRIRLKPGGKGRSYRFDDESS